MHEAPSGVRRLLGRPDFRRLLGTRLLSQFGDGVFQAALAGTVLFNPQRAADPVDVAAGFAVLLLPYSLVGPFAGVWLDRWSRRQVLVLANLARGLLVLVVAALIAGGVAGGPFYVAGLLVFAVNRFLLAALSAGLPHTVEQRWLVSANAFSTTAGTAVSVVGGGVAVAIASLAGSGDVAYAVVAAAAVLPYATASAVAAGFSREHLGPDESLGAERLTAGDVLRGMVAGARHVFAIPPAAAALAAMAVHRVCFGLLTLMTLLLYRNTFEAWGPLLPTGLAGVGQVLSAGAAGALLAAAVTPRVVRRIGKPRWSVVLLAAGGVGQVALGVPFVPPTAVAAGFVLGFVGQGVKICVDTTLQETVDDAHRGRVFSVYDTLFNVTFVVAVVAGAFLLPASGVSYGVLVGIGAAYLLTALAYAECDRRGFLRSRTPVS
ncbi:MFS transporter [Trujillonella endophytica]|uniref:Major Facilitator Superfamily protein n=1 Tax=Trujillonella endophytica TaxID=673521 RepID=A0A1H8VA99_9ACTN|nr:MFS transporter [Trujillella endophytica]SEP12223.1 Major Facilitator Superfamily protein [Trujillella endophytica]